MEDQGLVLYIVVQKQDVWRAIDLDTMSNKCICYTLGRDINMKNGANELIGTLRYYLDVFVVLFRCDKFFQGVESSNFQRGSSHTKLQTFVMSAKFNAVSGTSSAARYCCVAVDIYRRLIKKSGSGDGTVLGHWSVQLFYNYGFSATNLFSVPQVQRFARLRAQGGVVFSLRFTKNLIFSGA